MASKKITPPARGPFRTIGELFRRARDGEDRGASLRRFAEAMELDHVHLSLIEKGQRFPNEEVVRRLARQQGESPDDLVGVLWRDRIVAAVRRELQKALPAEGSPVQTEDRDVDDGVEEAIATWTAPLARVLSALPDAGEAVPLPRYRAILREALRAERGRATRGDLEELRQRLEARGLVECGEGGARKSRRHFQSEDRAERLDLALELAAVFAKGLTDKLFRGRGDSYVRHHFARIAPERIPEFQARLHAAIRELAEEFDAGEDAAGEQVRVLVSQVGDR